MYFSRSSPIMRQELSTIENNLFFIQVFIFFLMGIETFYYFCNRFWPHSSMDRISDSGSEDLGSNPGGVTAKKRVVKQLSFLLFVI